MSFYRVIKLTKNSVIYYPHSRFKRINFSTLPLSSLDELAVSPKIESISDSICNLSLLETSQLVKILQKRLNISTISPAPLAAPATPTPVTAAQEIKKSEEKSEFKLILQKFDPAAKAKIIREIKVILPQLNLVEAKALVESAPKLIREKVKRDEAEKIQKTLQELGATVTLD